MGCVSWGDISAGVVSDGSVLSGALSAGVVSGGCVSVGFSAGGSVSFVSFLVGADWSDVLFPVLVLFDEVFLEEDLLELVPEALLLDLPELGFFAVEPLAESFSEAAVGSSCVLSVSSAAFSGFAGVSVAAGSVGASVGFTGIWITVSTR